MVGLCITGSWASDDGELERGGIDTKDGYAVPADVSASMRSWGRNDAG